MALSSKDSDVLEPEIDSESENCSAVLNLKNSTDTQKYFISAALDYVKLIHLHFVKVKKNFHHPLFSY